MFRTKQFSSALRSLAILALLASPILMGTAFAQTLQLRYTFGDGPGTTTASSGALPVTLNMISGPMAANGTGTPVDAHGPAGSGVQQQGSCLDMTANSPLGNTGTERYAGTRGNATLGTGLGVFSNFTATVWFKMSSLILNNNNNACRFFVLATNGIITTTSPGGVGNFGMQINVPNQTGFPRNAIYFIMPNGTVSAPIYYNFPTNQWLFVGLTYDAGSSTASIYFGSEASPAKLYVSRTIAPTVFNFGNSADFLLGNSIGGARSFQGRIGDFRFYTGAGSASFIESIRQSLTPVVVTGLAPDGSVLMSGTNTLSFTATSASGVNSSGIKVLVNGSDVSSSLNFTATAGGQIVTYTNLPLNPTLITQSPLNGVNVNINITDGGGIVTSNTYTYDAFTPNNFTWECEDYDLNNGSYFDNPTYAFDATDPYFRTSGTPQTDYSDNGNGTGGVQSQVYRSSSDLAATEYSLGTGANGGNNIGELMRQKIFDALSLSNVVRDVDIGNFDGPAFVSGSPVPGTPNWVNYTRTFPTGAFNVYARAASGGGTLGSTLSLVTSGWGSSSQTTTDIGTFSFANTGGWETYAWVPLRDVSGNLIRVNLSGTNTFRLTANTGGGGNNNFLMLTPANTNLPTISGIYPNGTNLFQPASALTFTANSPGGFVISPSGISVNMTIKTTTGQTTVTNLTVANGGLVVTGPSTNRTVSAALVTNDIYTAVISVTDVNGSPASSTVSFDTLNPVYTWEAPDYDYGGGLSFADPIPVDGYLGQSGTAEIDYHFANVPPANTYRDSAIVGVENNGDNPQRLIIITNSAQPYDLGYYNGGNWLNYTRSFPAGAYNILVRAADGSTTGVGANVALAQVTSGQGTSNQVTANLGSFTFPPTGGWQTYTWTPLRDSSGNLVKFTGGSVETLRATSAGAQNVFFYALFPANTNVPALNNVYPNGATMFQSTNTFAFAVTSAAGVNSNSIVVTINGIIVSNLVFSGSVTNWAVRYPHLLPNSAYTIAVSVTDVNGNTTLSSSSFDTFSSANYTWEAEDFDHDFGQFIDNPQTNAYFGLPAGTDVDTHQVNFNVNAPYLYRTNTLGLLGEGNGMATEINGDVKRAQYLGVGNTNVDYSMGYFTGGTNASLSWANYTRHYPAGTYNVYGRMAAGGGVQAQASLAIVTGGWGTTTQTTNALGTFTMQSTGWESYNFLPLRDDSGNLVTITFNGSTNTLQVGNPATSGSDVNVNFLMLTPVFALTAAQSGTNVALSFPAQSGFGYQVQYKTNLLDPSWNALGGAIAGTNAVMSVKDPAKGISRFYRVQVQ
jgi:hypothetical protein